MALQLLVIFIIRFFIAFLFTVAYVYGAELFPVQVVGLALSMGGMVGSLSNALLPEVMNIIRKMKLRVMVVFSMIALLGLVGSFFLYETLGTHPLDRVP